MPRSNSGLKMLDQLERSSALSTGGKNWFIAAVDPFHDQDLALSGYPDIMSASTVVQCIKQQYQITVPSTVTSGSNWDASLVLFPSSIGVTSATASTISNNAFGTTAVVVTPIGGFSAVAGAQGAQLWRSPTVAPDTTAITVASGDPRNYAKGAFRVISMGFEVINSTAEINKQGQVMVWRLPSATTSDTLQLGTNPVSYLPYEKKRLPPGSVADAQLLFGSRSWAASEGCYIVARQNSILNECTQPDCRPKAYVTTDAQSATSNNNTIYTVAAINNPGTFNSPDKFFPFDISGAHFTGLSYATSLTVNVRWFIERVPGPQETDLVVLAQPSCCYDPLALELMAQSLCNLPPGVRLSENPFGEWFRSAVRSVANFAPKVGDALDIVIPGASLLGKGIGFVGSKIADKLDRSAEKKKGAPKPPPLPPQKGTASPMSKSLKLAAQKRKMA